MKFVIDVQPAAVGWEVRVLDADGAAPLNDPATGQELAGLLRRLRKLGEEGEGSLSFPLPPAEEVQRLATTEPHYALCAATDPDVIGDAYKEIVGRSPGTGGVEVFGRYLFDTLLGADLWAALKRVAGQYEPVELALTWRDANTPLNRLNWEMMHDGAKFLGEQPRVAITRRVPRDAAAAPADFLELSVPPRVLFVIGTTLNMDVIRPGAEYLGLLRSLKASNLRLRTRLLLQASVAKIETMMATYRPDIVHFICHGGFNTKDGQPFLSLVDNDKPTVTVEVKADNLRRVLCENTAGVRPPIVVLNACYSASTSNDFLHSGQVASPLAVSLAREGIPVVVAMAGEVADHACRLFTRRFYETLLSGGHLAFAAAEGRRAGIIMHGNDDPKNTVDWALPTLFLSDSLRQAQLRRRELPDFADFESIAEKYATPSSYPVFCGRLNLFWWYNLLMGDTQTQRLTSPDRTTFQYLALSVDQADEEGAEKRRYGRSWLLCELASQATREGHVPCFVNESVATSRTRGDRPKTFEDVLYAIDLACNILIENFKLDPVEPRHLKTVLQMQAGQALPPGFPEEVGRWYTNQPDEPSFLARLVRYELTRLLDQVCRQRARHRVAAGEVEDREGEEAAEKRLFAEEQKQTKLLLLVDDLHRMGKPAVKGLLEDLLGDNGLHAAADRVRAVVTYASVAAVGQEVSVGIITDWAVRREVQVTSLQGFDPVSEAIAYKQFLLNWRETNTSRGPRMPLTLRATATNSDNAEIFFTKLHIAAKRGVPSLLSEREEVADAIYEVLKLWPKLTPPIDILRPANDDAELERLAEEQAGRGQQR